jgi:hypothetical protein
MKFQVDDLVREIISKANAEGRKVNDDKGDLFRVVAIRTYEPCHQLEPLCNSSPKRWAITQELELVSRKSQVRSAKQAAR